MKQCGFFNVEECLTCLSGLGDQFEAFSQTVDFEAFRQGLNRLGPMQTVAKAVVLLLIRS